MGKYLGIVRTLDKLGRITVPKEYRKQYKLFDGTKMEIIAVPEQEGILIRKYKGEQ